MVTPLRPTDVPEAVRQWLPDDLEFEFPPQGTSSTVAFVVGAGLVVKRAAGALEASVTQCEFRAMEELAGSGLPVPEAVGLHVDGDQTWVVMSRLPGEPLARVIGRASDTKARCAWYRALGELTAQIHATSIPSALRPEGTWFERVLGRTKRARDRVRQLLASLDKDRPPDVPETLIHGDFTTDNVLADGDKLTGVIDWGGAGPGDPRYDVTLALATGPDFRLPPQAVGAFLEGYCGADIPKSLRTFFERTYQVQPRDVIEPA